MSKFYVKTVTAKGKTIAYAVYDRVNGLEREYAYFPITSNQPDDVAQHLAKLSAADFNSGIS